MENKNLDPKQLLLESFDGCEDTYSGFITPFFESYSTLLEELKVQVAASDYENMQINFHSLKGFLCYLQEHPVVSLIADLEADAKKK